MGFSEIQELGPKGKEKACRGDFSQPNGPKPKKHKNKKKKKKPDCDIQVAGSQGRPKMLKFQVGETSSAGASSLAAPSILGKFEWVSKAVGWADVGSTSAAAGELKQGLGSDKQEPGEVVLAPQRMPIATSRGVGGLGKAEVKPAIPCLALKEGGSPLSGSEGEILPGSLLQTMLGEGSSLEVRLPVIKDNVLVPWSSCGSVLNREAPSGPVVEVLSPVSGLLCCSQTEGEGASVLSQQTSSHGFKLVSYVEEEPIPLDWSQAVVGGRVWWVSGSRQGTRINFGRESNPWSFV